MDRYNKHITLRLTKEDLNCVDQLMKHFGENRSSVLKRAIIILHYITFTKNNNPPLGHLLKTKKNEE